ncbi:thioesterase II family protein [Kitasatospora sp. NPDC048296]|uniref:thioesterase II family protein n=1 Tax=Kitasatospora sp. NPDC048296 TaxID=3364048 RepID=UPI003722D247
MAAPRTPTATPYLPPAAGTDADLRLFCFHHAGGAASAYTGWQESLGPQIAVLPVQLPGRERRAAEPRFTRIDALVTDLDRHLDPLLDEPYAFYGHSMGALVAYHLTLLRAARGRSLPLRLMVGAYPPPHLLAPIADALNLDDAELTRWLVDTGGMSELVLGYPDWVRSALDLLRDDLRVCQSHRPTGDHPLPCPIDVFAGEQDPLLPLDRVDGWARHTTAGSRVHAIPGGHFFLHESSTVLLRTVALLLSGRAGHHRRL